MRSNLRLLVSVSRPPLKTPGQKCWYPNSLSNLSDKVQPVTKKLSNPCAHLKPFLLILFQSSKRVIVLKILRGKLWLFCRSLKLLISAIATRGERFGRRSSRDLASTALWGEQLALRRRGEAERRALLQLLLSVRQLHAQLANLRSEALDILISRYQLRILVHEQALPSYELILQPLGVALRHHTVRFLELGGRVGREEVLPPVAAYLDLP